MGFSGGPGDTPLGILKQRFFELRNRADRLFQEGALCRLEEGRLLKQMKPLVPEGQWTDFVEKELRLDIRRVQMAIRMVDDYEVVSATDNEALAKIAEMGMTDAAKWLRQQAKGEHKNVQQRWEKVRRHLAKAAALMAKLNRDLGDENFLAALAEQGFEEQEALDFMEAGKRYIEGEAPISKVLTLREWRPIPNEEPPVNGDNVHAGAGQGDVERLATAKAAIRFHYDEERRRAALLKRIEHYERGEDDFA